MRALVTGASGLLGTHLLGTVPTGVTAVALRHRSAVAWPACVQADLCDAAATRAAVRAAAPDVVIHAAYRKDAAGVVTATANVCRAAASVGAGVVHCSSEVVFAGDGRPRDEQALPDPVWEYGRWKAESEAVAVALAPDAAVVRVPLLVSLEPPDAFSRAVAAAAAEGRPMTWYRGEVRQAARAADVAAALWRISLLPPAERAGVWHLPGPQPLSRRELGLRLSAALGVHVDGSEQPAPDPRPADLRLSGDRARASIGWDPAGVP